MAADLWGDMDGVTDTQHAFGKGMTYDGLALDEVLNRLGDSAGFSIERQPGEPAGMGPSPHSRRRHLLRRESGGCAGAY